ncbi:MAG: zf-HC2 domain-containing protein [Bacteroidota bacterium]
MNTCNEYQEQISAYIDNELADAETSKLFYHLGECAECRGTMQSMLQLRSALFEIDQPKDNKNDGSSLWKRRISISYPIAALFAFFVMMSAIAFVQQTFFREEHVQPIRMEYISSQPLPTVYVIEQSNNRVQLN